MDFEDCMTFESAFKELKLVDSFAFYILYKLQALTGGLLSSCFASKMTKISGHCICIFIRNNSFPLYYSNIHKNIFCVNYRA